MITINNIQEIQDINYKLCKLDIMMLKLKIPYKTYIQKSAVIHYKNKTFYPKIFLTKYDYYKMLRNGLKKIYYLINSPKWKKVEKIVKKKKITIFITHSGFIIFKVI